MLDEWQTIRVPLDYAIQYVVDGTTGKQISETVIKSGTAYFGTKALGSDPRRDIYHYSVKFFFKNIPDLKNMYWGRAQVSFGAGKNESIKWKYSDSLGWQKYVVYASPDTTISMNAGYADIPVGGDMDRWVRNNGSEFFRPIEQKYIDCLYKYDSKLQVHIMRTWQPPYYGYDEVTYSCAYISDVSQAYLEIQYQPVPINTRILYPIDVYVKNDKALPFEWKTQLEDFITGGKIPQPKNPAEIYVSSNKLTVWDDSGHRKEYLFNNNTNQYTMSAQDVGSFSNGNIYFTIDATCSNGQTAQASSQFIVLGSSNAPDIISVSQDSFPVVTWECEDQISWQMVIKNGEELVYDSGMKAGDDKSYKVPVLIEDGIYSIEMRALNHYGYYTPWNASSFTLSPQKPEAINGIIVSANNKYGISVDCENYEGNGTLFVVRRKDSESKAEVVGEYKKGFVDYKIPLNTTYEYSIRHYLQGYTDSEWYDGTVVSEGVVLRKADDLSNIIKVWMSESEFEVIKDEEKTNSLMQVIGRTYPVLELGEWITSVRSFKGCVSELDFEKLLSWTITNASVVLQSNKEIFPCYINISDGGKHASGNRIVNFSLTRIDGD